MPKINPNVATMRVLRAKACLLFQCNYKLGRGGFNPKFINNPAWDQKRSDCSGGISHILMTQRAPKPGRDFWIETTAIYADAKHKRQVFTELDHPEPGCLVVYPDKGGKQGHVGVVVAVRGDLTYDTIECASGVLGKLGKAFRGRENAQNLFEPRGAIFVCLLEDLV